MSKIQVDTIVDKEDTGAPDFPFGATVTGIVTATSFSGDGATVTGIVTATSFSGDGAGLTGLNIPASSDWRDASLF
jgi:hypothetical protein